MCNQESLSFSTEQKQVTGVFFNNSQNGIIIYTEDTDNEHEFYVKFYNHLLDNSNVIVDKVIHLGSCDEVMDLCDADNDYSIPKLYVIDGDIYLSYKLKESKERLFVLDRYCIENYLLDENTICCAIRHFKTMSIQNIKNKLNYEQLMTNFAKCMLPVY